MSTDRRLPGGAWLVAGLLLAGCQDGGGTDADRPLTSREFPRADRPVPGVVSNEFSNEEARDDRNEANLVMDLAGIAPGMTVADIGAGSGYYTVRLSQRVGRAGRVLAQDIDDAALKRLGTRVERERLDNVSIKPGDSDDPRLPEASFDRIFLVHMYHEVTEPYAFIWRMRPALKPDGQVIVVDVDRPTTQHGIPPKLLFCEFDAVGYKLVEFVEKPRIAGYFARFQAVGPRPEPQSIKTCNQPGS
ncbi:class I SAM-dependent methyltransferase [Blastomonas sp.]|uniref:class I SAM-dependent methyltransferase n=1 Tax=Blastomonas sp. TaxID=1909299 RepID=UPI0035938BC9